MFKTVFTAASLAAASLFAAGASAQTIDVMVMQSDADPNSLEKGTQIQNSMLLEFQKVLNSPNVISYMRQFGIEGMDVIDETAVVAANPGYDLSRTRRSDQELLTLVRQIRNISVDATILYTVYARAVKDPFTGINNLQASLQYRVIGRDGKFLGGDNMALDTTGTPLTGCATAVGGQAPDPLCVRQAVVDNISRLAQDGANKIALQIAALIGQNYGSAQPLAPPVVAPGAPQTITPTPVARGNLSDPCSNLPVDYVISFSGIEPRQKNAIEEFMASWACAMNLELQDNNFSGISYRYKTRADRSRIVRNIRQMGEMMGMIVETNLRGQNEIIVETVGLRRN
ncbi:MAG: hypothetical protein ROR55_09270 [Devosia sp.]